MDEGPSLIARGKGLMNEGPSPTARGKGLMDEGPSLTARRGGLMRPIVMLLNYFIHSLIRIRN